jgi:hypothetical protein
MTGPSARAWPRRSRARRDPTRMLEGSGAACAPLRTGVPGARGCAPWRRLQSGGPPACCHGLPWPTPSSAETLVWTSGECSTTPKGHNAPGLRSGISRRPRPAATRSNGATPVLHQGRPRPGHRFSRKEAHNVSMEAERPRRSHLSMVRKGVPRLRSLKRARGALPPVAAPPHPLRRSPCILPAPRPPGESTRCASLCLLFHHCSPPPVCCELRSFSPRSDWFVASSARRGRRGRHRAFAVDGGRRARNPGQRWATRVRRSRLHDDARRGRLDLGPAAPGLRLGRGRGDDRRSARHGAGTARVLRLGRPAHELVRPTTSPASSTASPWPAGPRARRAI